MSNVNQFRQLVVNLLPRDRAPVLEGDSEVLRAVMLSSLLASGHDRAAEVPEASSRVSNLWQPRPGRDPVRIAYPGRH